MKKLIYSVAILMATAHLLKAQVGINTSEPKVTLHVVGANDNGAVAGSDGILVPRVSDLAASGTEDGQLVYLTTDSGAFTKGFHYWNTSGTASWTPIVDNNAIIKEVELRRVDNGNILSSEAGNGNNGLSLGGTSEDNIVIGKGSASNQDSGIRNVMIGLGAGAVVNEPGKDNIYLGHFTGRGSESIGANIALGVNAFRDTKGASGSDASGGNSIAIGGFALNRANLTSSNIAIGVSSGASTNLTSGNILLGSNITANGTIDSDNLFMGTNNGQDILAAGSQNVSVGPYALRKADIKGGNVAYGSNVFNEATMLSSNIAIGSSAGQKLKGKNRNILIGSRVGNDQEVDSNNIIIGNLIDFQQTGSAVSNTLNIQNAIFGKDNGTEGSDIDPNGKIGIGESDPKERLDVAGAVKIGTNTSFTITDGSTTTAPDGGCRNNHFPKRSLFWLDGNKLATIRLKELRTTIYTT